MQPNSMPKQLKRIFKILYFKINVLVLIASDSEKHSPLSINYLPVAI